MDRREALKHVALLMGGTTVIGGQLLLTGCQTRDQSKENAMGSLLTEADIALMDEIGETIIPATDTPGAKAVGIGSFMAKMVRDCYQEKEQETFKEGLNKIRKGFDQEFGYTFKEGTPEERTKFLRQLDKELAAYHDTKKEGDPEHYFRMLKELTLLGYFTSEIGSTQALNYVKVPGRYNGCVPYEKGGKAWATA